MAAIVPLHGCLLARRVPFSEIIPHLVAFMRNRVESDEEACLVAHNGDGFDSPLLVNELARSNSSFDLSHITTITWTPLMS